MDVTQRTGAVICGGPLRIEVFARGADDALYHIYQETPHAGAWSAWSSLGGFLMDDSAIG